MASFSLGIDLHKKFSYWTLINDKREKLWHGKVDTTEKATKETLKGLAVEHHNIKAAIEPVELWGWYADILEKNGVEVLLVDPYKTKLIAQSKKKCDKLDSLVLAEMLQSGFLATSYLAPIDKRDLKELLRYRIFLVRMRTRVKNRVHGILTKHGLSCPAKDLFGKKGLVWLKEQTIRTIFQEELSSVMSVLALLEKEISKFNEQINQMAKVNNELILLQSIPGVGPINALTIKAEVGDFSRFSSPEKLASYAGLVPSSYSSGGKTRFGRITKQGSRILRWTLVQAAQQPKPNWGKLYSFYNKIKQKKGSKVARVALARKIITIAWFLIKKQEPFDRTLALGSSGGVRQ